MANVPYLDLASHFWPDNASSAFTPISKLPYPAYRLTAGAGVTFEMDSSGTVMLNATGTPLTLVDGGTF